MTQDNRGGPPSRGGPGGNRKDGPQGGRRDDRPGGNRGGPRKGGFGKGPAKAPRAETYESLKEVVRGAGFRIDKFQVAEKGTHKVVKVEYRLIREGLAGPQVFARLADAQAAAIAPLPEPEARVEETPVEEAVVETDADTAAEMDAETSEGGPAAPEAEAVEPGEAEQ